MNSSSYSYHSSDSLFSSSTSARTSIDSNKNFLSVNCGPTLIKSCICFGNGTLEGNIESGLQFQHEAETAGYLLESENLLRQQVIDAQILIDGKYYQADQLVQRVAKLHDELVAIRTECSSVYNKGHALTTEQTKLMMISGITESLNSGFTTNRSPELNAAVTQGLTPTLTSSSLTSGLSSGLASRLTPAITPAYTPGIPPGLIQSYATGVDSGTLQTLKLMQIRRPLMKSAFVDQNLTEEEVNMKFVQDLLSWVEEVQVQLDRAEWGSDLPSVESHLANRKNVHKAIEKFESSLKEAKISEIQMTAPLKLSYAEKLYKLESQYSKLLNTSRNQERHLDTLHSFVSHATRELIWLKEKEEEEAAYDWSERNTNITRKKEYHAELMRELDQKEVVIKSVQEVAEQLLLENHPARLTIETYRAAMQAHWSWILQLCRCVEQHLRETAAYFEFFSDAEEAMEYLKNLKNTIYRKYSCDRSSSLHRLGDLVQESVKETEDLLQYKSTVAGLVGRAKAIIQLKPRNPDRILKTSIPIKAICDYRQIEVTIWEDDECVLVNNSHCAKWKVISPSGNEAMVPSVCFTVPPPNKEAIDIANRIEQQFQNVLALWHESHVNMKSVVSWHYLRNEIEAVRAGNVASIKTMLPGERQQVLSHLQSRFDDFVEDSQESKIFTSSDTAQLEKEVNVCKQYYQELLKSAEREEQEECIYNLYISKVRNIRLQLESCEERLIRQIRTPVERDGIDESVRRIAEQEELKKELDRLKDDLGVITDNCEEFFSRAAGSPSVPVLRSELSVVVQNMNQVYSMSSIYIDKLKTENLVLKNTQGAELLVKLYENKLCEDEAVTADKNNIENLMGTLKQWRSEVAEKRQVFHALEDELQKAKMISDQMFEVHKERDLDFDWRKEKVDQLAERWQNVHSQIENRLCNLQRINTSLKYYEDTYSSLDTWIQQMEDTQRKIQEIHPENSKALAKQLNQYKMLVPEVEMKQSKLEECQKYSEQYSAAVKDYELQTMTYRESTTAQQKSPVKCQRMQSSSDFIIQEFVDLRTRYTALVTLMSQYMKFASDSLKRLEEEEFHDKIDRTLESLKRIVERLRQPLSISAEVEKIKEQISANKNVSVDLEELQPVYETLKQRGEEMIARSEGTDKDTSAKAVQDKLDQMVLIWEDIQTLTEEREAKMLDVMELAEKFWRDRKTLVATIEDIQDFIREMEGPGVDPSVAKRQLKIAESAKEELDGLQEELETVVSLGSELRAACGEPDKPIVSKSIDEVWESQMLKSVTLDACSAEIGISPPPPTNFENQNFVAKVGYPSSLCVKVRFTFQLNSAWDALKKTWNEWLGKLVEAMHAAVQYQDGLQQFKTEAYQQQIEMERLNRQAELLLKKVTESDRHTVQDPLSELKLMWDSLEKIISRQHKLEGALLALGQFQHALDELLTWLTHIEDLLNEQKPVGGDPKAIEIELAKHHVLQNDVLAHQSTVEAVKKAGNDLTESSAVEEASNLRSKLELLNQRWQKVLEKTEQRKQQLDSALIQAQGFHGEVEDMQQWLTDTEHQLLESKPVGGLPETAIEQLNTRMLREFANFDIWREKYMRWMNHKKSRVMDFFKRIDKDQDGKITRQEFIDGILSSKFPTSQFEVTAVADIFDRDGDGYIDYYEFVAALHPNEDAYKLLTDADKIEDEVTRQVAKCKCAKRFQVEQIGDNKYRFGDSQQLRLVRILRSPVIVCVGGGCMALNEFLVKNDPCRAEGGTNVEPREKFILADGASQSMAARPPTGCRSQPSSRGGSSNRSTSLSSQARQAAALQALNMCTPEGTPIQGSKLRLPGFLSGRPYRYGKYISTPSTAATGVTAQFAETTRTPGRPGSQAGSKAGSRSSSRRGSDASDLGISEIQSVCSDMSETVPATSRPTPRAGSRPGSAKPSKIPAPQRRPLASKLDKSSKK
ncbi:dystonin-like [Podargus strigoides]